MVRGPVITLACAAGLSALVVTGCGGAGKPRPDLLFVSTRAGDYAIFAMNANGSHQIELTANVEATTSKGPFFQTDPAWSPDGRRVAFASSRGGGSALYVMRANGTDSRRLTLADDAHHPTWSPNGRSVAFEGNQHLEVVRSDGSDRHRVTHDLATESDPTWSPDGRLIAYVRKAPGTPAKEVWVVRPDGSGRRQLTRLHGLVSSPSWSPDGKSVAFSADLVGTFHIYSVDLVGKEVRRLTNATGDDIEPAWSPDGKKIAFSRDGAIWTVDATGGQEHRLTDPKDNDSSPAWKPRAKS